MTDEDHAARVAAHRARLDPTSPSYDPEFAAMRVAAFAAWRAHDDEKTPTRIKLRTKGTGLGSKRWFGDEGDQ
jgi:hypothetical protein